MSNTDTLEPGEQPAEAVTGEVVESEAVEATPEAAIPKLAQNASPRELLEFKLEVLKWEADRLLDEANELMEKHDKVMEALGLNAENKTAYVRALGILNAVEEAPRD